MKADADNIAGGGGIPTRSSLLSRLRDLDDNQTWRHFFETYWKLIYGVALKAGLRDIEVQEVVQDTVIVVSRNIGTFKYDRTTSSFKTWLLTVTRSRISNQFRRRQKHAAVLDRPDDEPGTDWLEQLPDEQANGLTRLWDEEWERNLMDAAIDRVKKRVPAEQFQLFFYGETYVAPPDTGGGGDGGGNSVPDAGSTLALFGLGLAGLTGWSRRLGRKESSR